MIYLKRCNTPKCNTSLTVGMLHATGLLLVFLLVLCLSQAQPLQAEETPDIGIVIHGGAGTIVKGKMTPQKEAAYKAKLNEALDTGYAILKKGGTSLDAVEAAIRIMEDSPLFNAGKGAVFTGEGKNELDASLMEGKTLNAGAVAGVQHIKNPISLARLVMEQSPHVMLSREGAESFAQKMGVPLVKTDYFYTKSRWEGLQKAIKKEKDEEQQNTKIKEKTALINLAVNREQEKFGTVGAAALDKHGNLAAGTSTGGMTNKKYGRIGDSPVIGAGTYADNLTCAVSCTGHGEYFIRSVVAYDVSALMKYGKLSLAEAADLVVNKKLVRLGGGGGLIAIDNKGNITMPFNTPGMYRGFIDKTGNRVVKIYND